MLKLTPYFGGTLDILDSNESSPCKGCEHINKSKLTFPACINCEKRFGSNSAKFLVSKGYKHQNLCKWPHGCNNTTVRAEYCSDHSSLKGARYAYWKDKGLTPEQLDAKIFAPRGKVGGQKKKIKERK